MKTLMASISQPLFRAQYCGTLHVLPGAAWRILAGCVCSLVKRHRRHTFQLKHSGKRRLDIRNIL
jgi:hypothetical protein